MKSRWILIAGGLVACGGAQEPAASSPQHASEPAASLARVIPVGARWTEHAHHEHAHHGSESIGDRVLGSDDSHATVDLVGVYTVLALGADAQPSRLSLAVQQLTVDLSEGAGTDGPESITLSNTVVFERQSDRTFTFVPESLDDSVDVGVLEIALHMVGPLAEQGPWQNPSFDVTEGVVPGSSWAIDVTPTIARIRSDMGLDVVASAIDGRWTLSDAGEAEWTLEATESASSVALLDAPPGATVRDASIAITRELTIPRDGTRPNTRDALRATSTVHVDIPTPDGAATGEMTYSMMELRERS